MLVKFLNSDSKVSTVIAGTYFKGDGWTGAYYDSGTGQLVFESEDGLGFATEDLRVATGGTYSLEWADVLNKPTSFPPSAHTHAWVEVQDKPASFPPSAHTHAWADITNKPTEFTPVSHTHTITDITNLQTELNGKSLIGHGHTIADVSGLQAELDGKQPTTTFKTINGTVITGTGDIVIPAGEDGEDGTSVVITVVNTEAAFESATPAQNELVVRIA